MNQPITDLAEAIRTQIAQRGDRDYTIPEIADAVMADHPEAVAEAIRTRQRTIVTRAVKDQIAPATEQPTLPGFDAIPLRISLPTEGGFIYRSTRVASLDDFITHQHAVLDTNITDAIRRRDAFAGDVDKIRALFEQHGVDRIADLPTS